jgi:hypothetical protein
MLLFVQRTLRFAALFHMKCPQGRGGDPGNKNSVSRWDFLSKANHFARVDKGWLEQIRSLDYNACFRNVGMSLRALPRGESLEFSSEASSSG